MKKEFIKHFATHPYETKHLEKEFNHSHQEGVSGHTSSLSPEDKEPEDDSNQSMQTSGSEFNLSEHEQVNGYFPKDKVKEFIKLLRKRFTKKDYCHSRKFIDKLAGKELI